MCQTIVSLIFRSVPKDRIGVLGMLLSVGLLAGCKPESAAGPAGLPPAPAVTVAVPVEREVQDYEDFTGRVAAQYTVEIRSRVTGYLDKIDFEDGAEVKEKDLLFVIDRRPFKAAYDSAMAQITLRKASLAFRDAEFKRNKELFQNNALSRSEYDQSAAALEEAKALVTAAEANTEGARLNLDFTEIRAPIAGRISARKIDLGNLVLADQTLLTTIVSVDPMYVNFDVDERRLLRIQQQIREGRIPVTEKSNIALEMALDIEQGYPHRGTLDFADNRIDQATGTIHMRGLFENPLPPKGMRTLVGGMFARLRVPLGDRRKAVLVAEQALGGDQGQKYLLVVDERKQVQYRRVKTGKLDGGLRVIEDGLQAGEQVIVGGLQRVRPGVTVEPKPVEMESFGSSPAEKK